MTKTCTQCARELEDSLFPHTGKGYRANKCKYCIAVYKKEWKHKNIDRVKDQVISWKLSNREQYLQSMRDWYHNNKDKPEFKRKRSASSGSWYYRNKDRSIQRSINYAANRKKKDPLFKMQTNLRSYLSRTFKSRGLHKNKHLMELLDCSWSELQQHIEKQFVDHMSWNNYGEWHIDHIKALANFDLSNPDQLKEAWHYTNLQPLWKIDNLRKSNK